MTDKTASIELHTSYTWRQLDDYNNVSYVVVTPVTTMRQAFWSTGKTRIPRNYTMQFRSTVWLSSVGKPPNGVYSDCFAADWTTREATVARNDAYEKFVKAVSDQSQWAVNLIEQHEAVEMIVSRVKQITRFASSLKKLDFGGAAKALNVKRPSGLKASSKELANNWLEFHFGWAPLVQDISSAVDTLSRPPKKRTIRSHGHGKLLTAESHHINSPSGSYSRRITQTFQVLYQADVVCSEPLLASANDLGFVNLLSTGYEVIPYSFVVDWFTNLGQVLSAATDLLGYSLSNSFVSEKGICRSVVNSTYDNYQKATLYDYHVDALEVNFQRRLGPIPGPSLVIKPFHGFGLQRGATAVALLLQHL